MDRTQSMLSLDEAAQRMKSTKLNVLMHLKRGLISGEEHDGQWSVSADSLTDYLQSGQQPSEQVICRSHCNSHGCGSCG